MVILLISVGVVFAVLAVSGLGLATLAVEGGDLPEDARSTVVRRGSGCDVTVTNPGDSSAVIGLSVRRARIWDVEPFTQRLVIRPSRRSERRRSDRGALTLLGVVEQGRSAQWSAPVPAGTVRVRVVIGQAGARLRIHDHRVGPLASPTGSSEGAGWPAGRP